MTVQEALKLIEDNATYNFKNFYSESVGNGIAIGTGVVLKNVAVPQFNRATGLYETVSQFVMVFSHECDLDQTNIRPFNGYALVCPVVELSVFVDGFLRQYGEDKLRSFLVDLAKREISRVFFSPYITGQLTYGGILYLNQITFTHVEQLSIEKIVAVTSRSGLRVLDEKLHNHLFREKADLLPGP